MTKITLAAYIKKRGIVSEKADPSHQVHSIGFQEAEGKWYGWSHRAIYGFGVGYTVKKGDALLDGKDAPPVGFTAKTLDDCKRLAVAFADAVS